ncbi:two-component regulator propeller domain-containing protein [uncultured Stenotrophomonas sp.]|uniref:two-component regulator propeller domain-containing protein n=1 Tax=uncultured Stenotrophomonas sp. TaxID=165438 RepID=UPI0028EA25ED|nr:two-component regulator propeller domain-containing protein [uncultured Stenotrophomonas sp.]
MIEALHARLRCLVALLIVLLLAGGARAAPPNALRFTTADGLPSNAVHQVVEDRVGYLWFATDDGLARFDGERFRIWRREQGLSDNQLLSIAVDDADQLWIGTAQGQLMRMSADRNHIAHFDRTRYPVLAHAAIGVVLPTPDRAVWFGSRDAGLFRLGPDQRLRQFLPAKRGDGLPDRRVDHLALTADGTLWVGTPRGLARWREGRFVPAPALLADAPVSGLLVDAQGHLWVGGAAGPWRWTRAGQLDPVDASAGTRALGLSRHGGPWLGDDAQVWRPGAEPLPDVAVAPLGSPDRPQFRSALEDRHGSVWLLGRHLGVWRLPPHWQHFQPVDRAPVLAPAANGVQLAQDLPAVQLVCADGSRWRLDAAVIERHPPGGAPPQRWRWDTLEQAPPRGPLALHCDAGTGLWWGGRHGLSRWQAGRFHPVPGVDAEVSALHGVDAATLWVASPERVRRYHIQDGVARPGMQVDARQGLPAVRLASLATDAHGAVWATSARGLLQLRPREGLVRMYTRSDGVPDAVINAQLQADGTWMLAVDRHGRATRFDPMGLATRSSEPALVVERVQLYREGVLQTLPAGAAVSLRPDDRDVQVSVRLLGAAVQARQQYRFRVCGLDREWIRVGRSGTRGFARLPPGEHRLEFQARLADGSWSSTRTLLLQVEHSGWYHPVLEGARVGAGVLLAGGGAWAAFRRIARGRRADASSQRLALALRSAQAKSHYLATLGHEIRTPLTGVLGMSELLLASPLHAAQRRPLEQIRAGGQTLLARVNAALDEARLEAGCAPLQSIEFDVVAVHRHWLARQVLASCRRGTALALCLHVAAGVRAHGDPQRLAQLLDAVARTLGRRTGAGRVVLQVAWRPGRDGLLLAFDAAGRAAPRAGRASVMPTPSVASLRAALAAAERLAAALGGALRVHAVEGRQWRVQVSLPMPAVAGTAGSAVNATAGRVLLVDDDRAAAVAGCALLRAQGMHAVHAANALAALTELTVGGFDAVLVDTDLPGLDGVDLLGLLQAKHAGTPVLAMCGQARPGLANRVHAAGGGHLLRKPVSATMVRQALRRTEPATIPS